MQNRKCFFLTFKNAIFLIFEDSPERHITGEAYKDVIRIIRMEKEEDWEMGYGRKASDQTEKYHRKVLGKIGPGDWLKQGWN